MRISVHWFISITVLLCITSAMAGETQQVVSGEVPEGVSGSAATCPIPKTGQTISYRTGDDGDLRPGAAWPSPRFMDNGDGTVTDNLSGLVWVKAPQSLDDNRQKKDWNSAIDFCNELTYVEHTDWRLPSRTELRSLIDYGKYSPALPDGHPFAGVYTDYELYWTSTANSVWPESKWAIGIKDGRYDSHPNIQVWPVRGGATLSDHRSTVTNCAAFAAGFILKWVPEYGWDSVVKCSTNLITMPFTDLSGTLPYPVNSYTDTFGNVKCFYKVELRP